MVLQLLSFLMTGILAPFFSTHGGSHLLHPCPGPVFLQHDAWDPETSTPREGTREKLCDFFEIL